MSMSGVGWQPYQDYCFGPPSDTVRMVMDYVHKGEQPPGGGQQFMDHLAQLAEDIRRASSEKTDFLDELERRSDRPFFPVDRFGRINVIRTGVPFRFPEGGEDRPVVVGVGRVGPPDSETEPTRDKYIQPSESRRLLDLINET